MIYHVHTEVAVFPEKRRLQNMTEIYTVPRLECLKKKLRVSKILIPAFLFGGLLACILLCTGVNTANADRRQLITVLTAVLTGWAAICIFELVCRPAKAKKEHFERILAEPAAERTGTLISAGDKLYIPRSICIRKVTILFKEGTEVLNILADQATLLPAPGTEITVRTVCSYIAGIGGGHA